jgi:hypothetical protein
MVTDISAPERVFIIGGSGSGKTTLARRIAEASAMPVHHLDEIARIGGGTGPERSAAEKAALTAEILQSRRWVAEGIHLGWTNQLIDAADVVVWLDHVSWRHSSQRIAKRFLQQALLEMRRQKGHRKFTRIGDYARQLYHLLRAIPETRAYHTGEPGSDARLSRTSTVEQLAPHAHKLVHCRTPADVQAFLDRFTAR